MKEHEILEKRSYTRVFSSLPYGKYVAQAGTAHSSGATQNSASVYLHSRIKVLAIFSSTRRPFSVSHRGPKVTVQIPENTSTTTVLSDLTSPSTTEEGINKNEIKNEIAEGITEDNSAQIVRCSSPSMLISSERSVLDQTECSSSVANRMKKAFPTSPIAHTRSIGEKRHRDSDNESDGAMDEETSARKEMKDATNVSSAQAHKPQRHIYFRLQYDKSCIETLPLELMRERHPQVLIDYLLSNSLWS